MTARAGYTSRMTSAPPRLVVTGFRVALAALVLAGCKSKPAPEAAPPPAPLAADADGFIVARPTAAAAAPPAARAWRRATRSRARSSFTPKGLVR